MMDVDQHHINREYGADPRTSIATVAVLLNLRYFGVIAAVVVTVGAKASLERSGARRSACSAGSRRDGLEYSAEGGCTTRISWPVVGTASKQA